MAARPWRNFKDSFEIERSSPHGHVAAVLGTLRKLKLDTLIDSEPSEERNRVMAMIVARILDPRSKLATARGLDEETSTSTLAEILEVQKTDAQVLYTAMDWLGERQAEIEKKLAKRHLEDGALVLYDVSSTYFEGKCCPLGQLGHSRDGKRGKLQIVFGLLCNRAGCPVAVEVFDGNTADPKTLGAQIEKLRHRFKLSCVVLVGDRGMITEARIRDEIKPIEGLDWITALRAPAIRQLVETGKIQLSFFDERELAEIQSPDYPGERLIVCKNPLMAVRRAKKRQALLEATEHELNKIVTATERSRRPLKGEAPIGLRVGKVLHRFKMAKHFRLDIREAGFSYARDEVKIAEEAALDGILRRPHQRAKGSARHRGGGACLQRPRPRRAGVSQLQDRRSQGPPHLPLLGRLGPCPRLSLHARLLRRVAYDVPRDDRKDLNDVAPANMILPHPARRGPRGGRQAARRGNNARSTS